MMKALFATIIIVVALTACTNQQQAPAVSAEPPTSQEKSGITTLTGMVEQVGKQYWLSHDGERTEVSSYTVDLSIYVGKTVSLTGQYSGDTLFVQEAK